VGSNPTLSATLEREMGAGSRDIEAGVSPQTAVRAALRVLGEPHASEMMVGVGRWTAK